MSKKTNNSNKYQKIKFWQIDFFMSDDAVMQTWHICEFEKSNQALKISFTKTLVSLSNPYNDFNIHLKLTK